jgi:ATP-dependent Lhr-like helicase
MLKRVRGRVIHMALSRVSPLAVPVLLEIGRESVRSGADEERLLAEAEAIIAEGMGDAEPPGTRAVGPMHWGSIARRGEQGDLLALLGKDQVASDRERRE